MSSTSKIPSYSELPDELSGWLAGGGILTMALFPLAIPLIALTAVAVIPLLLVPLAAGLVVAVVAAPILLMRKLGRVASRALQPTRTKLLRVPHPERAPTHADEAIADLRTERDVRIRT